MNNKAISISIVSMIISLFGVIPDIKSTFFNKPLLTIDSFMPVVVFDEGNNIKMDYPKFTLRGVLKVINPNSYDISLNEMKLYGISRDTIGYKIKDKRVIYRINVSGIVEPNQGLVKSYGTSYISFNFWHFENTESIGVMNSPLSTEHLEEYNQMVFDIYSPYYGQLFKHNLQRQPHSLVDEVESGELSFSVVFNNKIYRIPPKKVLDIHHCQIQEYSENRSIISAFNVKRDWEIGRK